MQELQSLPPETRRGIARRVADEIGPLLGKRAADRVRELRHRAQDERWRLLSQGFRSWADVRFGPVVLSEQWAIAKLEIIDGAHPIREILAERRLRTIESFVRDSLPELSDDAA
jgi:hypothetical protein